MSKIDENGYTKDFINLTELNTVLANTYYDNKDGIVLDVICPSGQIIKIPGVEDFSKDCQVEKIPRFEIKITTSDGKELSPETKVKILKNKILREGVELCELYYKDISMTNFSESLNKYKSFKESFRFKKQIELKSDEHLKFKIDNSIEKIENIKFNLGVYLLYKND